MELTIQDLNERVLPSLLTNDAALAKEAVEQFFTEVPGEQSEATKMNAAPTSSPASQRSDEQARREKTDAEIPLALAMGPVLSGRCLRAPAVRDQGTERDHAPLPHVGMVQHQRHDGSGRGSGELAE